MFNKKRLAAKILKVSPKKVVFAADALEEINKAITRSDIRGLIAVKKIYRDGSSEQSRARARRIASQKRKGRQRSKGSRKGSKYSVKSKKEQWMVRVRVQRRFIQELKIKNLVSLHTYRMLYQKVKGGYFRNKRHIKLYLTEYHLFQTPEVKSKPVKPAS